jgi:hypothetical protein
MIRHNVYGALLLLESMKVSKWYLWRLIDEIRRFFSMDKTYRCVFFQIRAGLFRARFRLESPDTLTTTSMRWSSVFHRILSFRYDCIKGHSRKLERFLCRACLPLAAIRRTYDRSISQAVFASIFRSLFAKPLEKLCVIGRAPLPMLRRTSSLVNQR